MWWEKIRRGERASGARVLAAGTQKENTDFLFYEIVFHTIAPYPPFGHLPL